MKNTSDSRISKRISNCVKSPLDETGAMKENSSYFRKLSEDVSITKKDIDTGLREVRVKLPEGIPARRKLRLKVRALISGRCLGICHSTSFVVHSHTKGLSMEAKRERKRLQGAKKKEKELMKKWAAQGTESSACLRERIKGLRFCPSQNSGAKLWLSPLGREQISSGRILTGQMERFPCVHFNTSLLECKADAKNIVLEFSIQDDERNGMEEEEDPDNNNFDHGESQDSCEDAFDYGPRDAMREDESEDNMRVDEGIPTQDEIERSISQSPQWGQDGDDQRNDQLSNSNNVVNETRYTSVEPAIMPPSYPAISHLFQTALYSANQEGWFPLLDSGSNTQSALDSVSPKYVVDSWGEEEDFVKSCLVF